MKKTNISQENTGTYLVFALFLALGILYFLANTKSDVLVLEDKINCAKTNCHITFIVENQVDAEQQGIVFVNIMQRSDSRLAGRYAFQQRVGVLEYPYTLKNLEKKQVSLSYEGFDPRTTHYTITAVPNDRVSR